MNGAGRLRFTVASSGRNPVLAFRKHYVGYLKGLPGISRLRNDLMKFETLEDVVKRLNAYAAEHP